MKQIMVLAIVLTIFFTGCTRQRVFPNLGSGTAASSMLQNGKVLLVVRGDVKLSEFKKTYRDKFQSTQEFHGYVKNKVQSRFSNAYKFSELQRVVDALDNSDGAYAKDIIKENQSLLLENEFKSVLVVDRLHVGSEYETHTYNNAGAGFGGGTTTSSSESARVEARFEVITVEDAMTISEFVVVGTQDVFLFAFESALLGAVNEMTLRADRYLKQNKIKF